jgi:DNA-binding XRE family transcriptional regulator
VKTPHIEINVKGNNIPSKILTFLKEEYGKKLHITDDNEDESVDVFQTDWYKNTKSSLTPGFNLKLYRQMKQITQSELGQLLGEIPKQHISNMEKDLRPISLKTAKKLAKIFHVSVEKFI